jgi:hypothetical protein
MVRILTLIWYIILTTTVQDAKLPEPLVRQHYPCFCYLLFFSPNIFVSKLFSGYLYRCFSLRVRDNFEILKTCRYCLSRMFCVFVECDVYSYLLDQALVFPTAPSKCLLTVWIAVVTICTVWFSIKIMLIGCVYAFHTVSRPIPVAARSKP